jgi:hypothetical protein
MGTEMTMREASNRLRVIQESVELIILNMNTQDQGGFERHMMDLRHHTADAVELLNARIAGQLVQTPLEAMAEDRLYDKQLYRC